MVARLLFPFAPETNLMATIFQGIDRTTEQMEIVSPSAQQGGIVDSYQTDFLTVTDRIFPPLYCAPYRRFSGSYKDSLASLALNESKELLKERLDSIMNFKKKTKWGIVISLLLTVVFICGFAFSGAYAADRQNQTKPDDGADTVSLHTNSEEIVGFQSGEQITAKDVALNITEDDVKIQLNAVAGGDSNRTLEIIDPFVWGFTSDTDISPIDEDSPLFTQIYDYYRTYEQTKADIQNG